MSPKAGADERSWFRVLYESSVPQYPSMWEVVTAQYCSFLAKPKLESRKNSSCSWCRQVGKIRRRRALGTAGKQKWDEAFMNNKSRDIWVT
jgi:hypothetical protein